MTNMKQYIESGNWKDLPEDRWTITYTRRGEGITYRHETVADDIFSEHWRTFNESKKPLNQELLDYLLS